MFSLISLIWFLATWQTWDQIIKYFCLLLHRSKHCVQIHCCKERKGLKGNTKATKKLKEMNNALDDKDQTHILWWKEVFYMTLLNVS